MTSQRTRDQEQVNGMKEAQDKSYEISAQAQGDRVRSIGVCEHQAAELCNVCLIPSGTCCLLCLKTGDMIDPQGSCCLFCLDLGDMTDPHGQGHDEGHGSFKLSFPLKPRV